MAKVRYSILKQDDGKWHIVRQGQEQGKAFKTQQLALEASKKLVADGHVVLVYNKDGEVRKVMMTRLRRRVSRGNAKGRLKRDDIQVAVANAILQAS